MYIIYIPILFLLYILFLDVYNKYYVKFIVVSNNDKDVLKIHTKPNPRIRVFLNINKKPIPKSNRRPKYENNLGKYSLSKNGFWVIIALVSRICFIG